MSDFDVAVTAFGSLCALTLTYMFVLVLAGAVEGNGTLKAVPLVKRKPAPPPAEPAADPVAAPLPLPDGRLA